MDVVTNEGRRFIIGRTVGTVFNPVVGGPDRVVNLESSAKTHYDGLLVEFERRYSGRFGLRAGYTWSNASNYSNDDQIPFGNGPIDPNDLDASSARRPTISGTVSRYRAWSALDAGSPWLASGRSPPECRWTSCSRTASRGFPSFRATPAPGSSRQPSS